MDVDELRTRSHGMCRVTLKGDRGSGRDPSRSMRMSCSVDVYKTVTLTVIELKKCRPLKPSVESCRK